MRTAIGLMGVAGERCDEVEMCRREDVSTELHGVLERGFAFAISPLKLHFGRNFTTFVQVCALCFTFEV